MFEMDINISPEREDAVVCLGEVKFHLFPVCLLSGPQEGQLTSGAERNTDRDVLGTRSLRVVRSRVVMKGLPVGRIFVPIEPGSNGSLIDGEIFT